MDRTPKVEVWKSEDLVFLTVLGQTVPGVIVTRYTRSLLMAFYGVIKLTPYLTMHGVITLDQLYDGTWETMTKSPALLRPLIVTNSEEAKMVIRTLPAEGRAKLDQLCSGAAQVTGLDPLIQLTLLVVDETIGPYVPTFVHVAWAELCSEEIDNGKD